MNLITLNHVFKVKIVYVLINCHVFLINLKMFLMRLKRNLLKKRTIEVIGRQRTKKIVIKDRIYAKT